MIFPNDNLEALGRYQPVTTGEDLHLPRIGAAKVRRYAEPFLEAFRVWIKSHGRKVPHWLMDHTIGPLQRRSGGSSLPRKRRQSRDFTQRKPV